jgi:hypothetical protein
MILSYDAKKAFKAHANGIFILFHMEIYPAKHIVGFTPGDHEIASPSAFHNICFCRHYLLIWYVLCYN